MEAKVPFSLNTGAGFGNGVRAEREMCPQNFRKIPHSKINSKFQSHYIT